MPPKLEQASPSDFQSVLASFRNASSDPDKAAACLQSALGWGQAQWPTDAGAQWELLASLNKLANSQELVLRTAAIKVIARLTCISWQAQTQLHTHENAKVAWAIIVDLSGACFDQPLTREATADGSLAKKVPAMPVKSSPAETVPSLAALPRQAVDAALRVLIELAIRDANEHLGWLLQGPHTSFKHRISECESPKISTLVGLLKIPSARIQHRTAQLIGVLATCKTFQPALTASVQPLHNLGLENLNASARLAALQALQKLLGSDTAGLQQLVGKGLVKQLMDLLVFTSQELKAYTAVQAVVNAAAPTRPGAGKQVLTGLQGVNLEYSKPAVTSPADLQLATLQLIGTVCHHNQSATEQLALQGGLQLLMCMLPSSIASADTADAPANNGDVPPQQRGRNTPSPLPPVTPDEDLNSGKAETAWESCLSIQAPALPPLPSTASQVAALRVVTQLLSIPGLANALALQLASISSSGGQPLPENEAAQGANAENGLDAASNDMATSKTQQEHIVQQLLHLFSGAQLPVTSTDDLAGKGSKSAEKPKLSGKGKGEVQDTGSSIASHLLPPFPAEVRGAAMDAIATLAIQPEAAKWLADNEEVDKIVQRCGKPGSHMSTGTDSTKSMPGPSMIVVDVMPGSDATTAEVQLAHGLSLLLLSTRAVQSNWRQSNAATVKKLAAASVEQLDDYRIKTALAAAALTVSDQELVAPPRPPLPSPPGTPPPLPLATSMFVWDALDRPMMADGKAKLTYI